MALSSPAELAERCQPIELLVTDVDGVMTDGRIVLDISTFEMAWLSPCGTKPANNRPYSPAEKRLQSPFAPQISRSLMYFWGLNRKVPRFVHSSPNSD
jgi:hypothetical protein